MKTHTGKLTITMLALVIATMALTQNTTKAMDYSSLKASLTVIEAHAVRKTIQQHLDGITKGDAKMLDAVWDKDAQVRFIGVDKWGKDVVQTTPVSKLIKQWTAKPSPDSNGVIMSVDVVNDRMASAKVALKWNGSTLIDYLTLMKTNGQWRIVNKAFVDANPQPKRPSLYGLPG